MFGLIGLIGIIGPQVVLIEQVTGSICLLIGLICGLV